MKKILFVTYGGGHVNMVIPVAKYLMSKTVHVEVFALTTARRVVEQENIPCFSCRDLPLSDFAYSEGVRLLREMGGGHPEIPEIESISYLGLSFESLVNEYGKEIAESKYKSYGRQAFSPVSLMENVIEQGEYSLVVATNSPRMEKAAILAARKIGVPSLCMVDLFALQGVAWIGQPDYANKVCVLTDSVKSLLLKAGRMEDEVVVTGNPAFDCLAAPALTVRSQELRLRKGWGGKKVILWCSQPEPDVHPFTGEKGDPELPFIIEKKIKEICDFHLNESWMLVVRPHPSENMHFREQITGIDYCREDELHALLKAVDVVVVMSSTVGLEAALLGKPVVSLNMSVFSSDMPLSEMGMALGVKDLNEIDEAIKYALKRGGAVCSNLPQVGEATQRISGEILKLLNSS